MTAYISTATNFNNNKFQAGVQNSKNQSMYGQFEGVNNNMANPPLGAGSIHHNSSNHFTMNSFMPSNLTSALYNQATQNQRTEYNYDINL